MDDFDRDPHTPEVADAPAAPGPDDVALPGFEAPGASQPGYQVLARKYRPQTFEDLIGQDAMVRTLTNAFQAGRVAHAYMLTGVRGVGKTTTARLIARALNYETDTVKGPSIRLEPPGRHCAAIAKSSHVDVMEMDAASRTGVGDIREILEGVRYSPVSARYKVYIIDEVHMLSTSAFNALLKTLEEPPAHVKFIFATTEIRKVPVTVLSRCQRFDLKRVDRSVLADHLERIARQEGANVEREGLMAIARAAEGSVRDALSLLDQAIVQAERDGPVSAANVRDMLGLADRSRVLDLLSAALEGRAKDALEELRAQYDAGADPQVLMRDVLDYLHAMSRIKAVGEDAEIAEARETIETLSALASKTSLAGLTRLWKTALSGLDDVRNAPDPVSAAEMAIIRLMAAASLPSPEDAARLLAGGVTGAASGAGAAAPQAPAPGPQGQAGAPEPEPEAEAEADDATGPASLDELVALVDRERDIALKRDVERYVRPVTVRAPKLIFEAAKGAPSDLGGRLSAFLQEQTGARWLVDGNADARGGETLHERRVREHRETLERAERDPAMVRLLTLFPGAELLSVETPQPPAAGADAMDAPADADQPSEDTIRKERRS
ncbi:DNA polymerase III subunit gamma/tau [Marinicauda pacifica]|uniref:DNA polymerase III subunit gamma/tau n=2 Tax=Marinicauda pacifica TaxID=1133559 RepID=A0A4S2HA90_9PROT|nr:DNA polymerase III subunit gamma/tau [Marinicauda pacifica]TGY92837.1 DNA polymerase III subunit gamma/tau [Marinicauda pacifica]